MAVRREVYHRKIRNSGDRKRKPIIYFATEGKNKTETLYFKAFGHDVNRNVRFASGNYTDPINMVAGLKTYMQDNDFSQDLGDKAFCLIDADVSPSKNAQIAKAVELAEKSYIQVIVSAPCFEYWFLCHFSLTGKKFLSNSELLSEIERYIPGYHKNTPNIYETLKSKLPVAIYNAQSMEKRHIEEGEQIHTVDFTPSSEVYHIALVLNSS